MTHELYPQIFQAVPTDDYKVYAYCNDGLVRLFDAAHMIQKGGVFEPLKDIDTFKSTVTIIGNTIAWDLIGNRDESKCIDIDPFTIFESPIVRDPLEQQ